ncbi:MAG TPA: hypothetical protein VEV39_16145 [Gemmatimonadales bacterium]|nr:hypothetical protein [Gemmatimonadales bacterium]
MFRTILFMQWTWARNLLLVGTLAAFAIPVVSAHTGDLTSVAGFTVRTYLENLQTIGTAYPILAGVLGLLLAMTAWGPDHRGRHVYALTLPLPRWKYALLRYAAGLTLLALPVLALWIAALIASAGVRLPVGLSTYPTALATRFALAAVVAYSAFSAISAGTSRTAAYLLGALVILLVAQLTLSLANTGLDVVSPAFDAIFIWPGPLAVFSGRWMLIDV